MPWRRAKPGLSRPIQRRALARGLSVSDRHNYLGILICEWNGLWDVRLGYDQVRVAYGPLVGTIDSDSQAFVHRPDLGAFTINLDDIDLDGDGDLGMGMLEDTPFDGIGHLEGPLTAVFLGPVQF